METIFEYKKRKKITILQALKEIFPFFEVEQGKDTKLFYNKDRYDYYIITNIFDEKIGAVIHHQFFKNAAYPGMYIHIKKNLINEAKKLFDEKIKTLLE